jgi:hypothetical protein
MKNTLFFHSLIIIFTAGILPFDSSGQNNSPITSPTHENITKREILWADLEKHTQLLIRKYANIRSHEKACKFITSDLIQFLYKWYEGGKLKGDAPEKAFIVKVGHGKTLKNQIIMDVMVVEVGLAFIQPSIFTFKRMNYHLKSKTPIQYRPEYNTPPINAYDKRC